MSHFNMTDYYSGETGGGGVWDPTLELPSGGVIYNPQAAFLQKDDLNPPADGETFLNWIEATSSGLDLQSSPGVTGTQPIYRADPDAIGVPAAEGVAAANKFMVNSNIGFAGSQTWIVGIRCTSISQSQAPVARANDSVCLWRINTEAFALRKNSTGGNSKWTPDNVSLNRNVVTFEFDAVDTMVPRLNGTAYTGILYDVGVATQTAFRLFAASSAGSRAADSLIYYVIAYPGINPSYRTRSEDWLKNYLSIP